MHKKISRVLLSGIVLAGLSAGSLAYALITNGSNAVDVIGQNVGSIVSPTPSYTTSGTSFGANELGFYQPAGIVIDSVNHRLFISDATNNRIIVHSLDVDDELVDYIPDNVLGQSVFGSSTASSSQSRLNNPQGLALDEVGGRLFVADMGNHRVSIFDVASITDGENAVSVLGQTNFGSSSAANTQAGLNTPIAVAYDAAEDRLFVSERNANRVKVFDVASITDGENATNVLGQVNFTGTASANTQTGLNSPREIIFDSLSNRLFVAENTGNRVKVFDVSTSTMADGLSASNVLGQANFTGATAANTQAGLRNPHGLALDSATNRLFVAETGGNRVKVFDVSTSTMADGLSASNVLGQANFTGAGSELSQTGGYGPVGLGFNSGSGKLFVSDLANRVMVYDVASITDGETAVDALGQYVSVADLTPLYTVGDANMSPNELELNNPSGVAVDEAGHRLFVSDYSNNRVLVYNLDSENELTDRVADYVLGQPNFRTSTSNDTQSGLDSPMGITFDAENQRLFVAEELGNRVKVFDVASITNGENATNVFGQLTFTSSSFDTTQSKMNGSQGMAYDAENDRLFIADRYNNRVMVFDVATIDNGEDAVNVLGQANFDDSNSDLTDSTLYQPKDVAYDSTTGLLFVADMYNSRVMVFDVNSITNGEPAAYVLGQADFVTTVYDGGQSLLIDPIGLAIDSDSSRLFVSEGSENRVVVFDVSTSTIANGMPASNVIGQANFDTTGYASTISALSGPRDIDFDHSNGRLYVSEYYGSRVKVFDAATTTPVVEEEAPAPVVVETPRAKGTSSARRASNIASMGGSAPVASAGASGGDAVVSTVDLATFIERLKAILAGNPAITATQSSGGDLDLGSRGEEVARLQRFLADKAVGASAQALATVGATGYFGQMTQRALAEYQASVGISPAAGYFGPKTRAHLESVGY